MFMIYAAAGSAAIVAASFYSRRDKHLSLCVAEGLLIISAAPLAPSYLLSWLEGSRNFDLALSNADAVLHLDSQLFQVWCCFTPRVGAVVRVVYYSLPLAMALAWVLSGRPKGMVRAMLLSLTVFAVYALVPAAGPALVFEGFPLAPRDFAHYRLSLVPCNAFPSMHLGSALLILLNARGTWLRIALALYAVLTGMAAVGSGEHYFVDLIAAVPFCAAVQYWTERSAR